MESLHRRLAATAAFDVVGVGEASWDTVWRVATTPARGGKARAGSRETLGGGQVATALVACRRLGLRAAYHARLGDDGAGAAILDELRIEGVDVSAVAVLPGATSHTAVVVLDAEGERTVVWHEDARTRMGATGVSAERASSGRLLHVDGNDLAASTAAARAARAARRVVSCDVERVEAGTLGLLALVDVAIVTGGVARELGRSDEPAPADRPTRRNAPISAERPPPPTPPVAPEARAVDEGAIAAGLRRLTELGATVAVATLGDAGALAFDGRQLQHVPAFRLASPVDTTACGDTFRAGFIAALLDRGDLDRCLVWATTAAGLKTRDIGRRGCPRRDELVAAVAAAPPPARRPTPFHDGPRRARR